MSNSQLTLGPFVFEGLESPERIVLKSKQRLAVHHLGSGLSVTDSLGQEYQSIGFQGAFTGLNAANRIRSIDRLRIQGMPLLFRWSSQALFVILQEFELRYKSSQWVDYRISCLVVQPGHLSVQDTDDVLTASASSQVKEIIALLQDMNLNLTSLQENALLSLSKMKYDMAPQAALQSVQRFLSMIHDRLFVFKEEDQKILLTDSNLIEELPQDIAKLIIMSGRQAKLMTARNRLLDITVRAESINGP